jgi:hypothetical protein
MSQHLVTLPVGELVFYLALATLNINQFVWCLEGRDSRCSQLGSRFNHLPPFRQDKCDRHSNLKRAVRNIIFSKAVTMPNADQFVVLSQHKWETSIESIAQRHDLSDAIFDAAKMSWHINAHWTI